MLEKFPREILHEVFEQLYLDEGKDNKEKEPKGDAYPFRWATGPKTLCRLRLVSKAVAKEVTPYVFRHIGTAIQRHSLDM